MSTYVIGDIQGCYSELRRLIDTIDFDPIADRLWFTGDLVNRGKDNLATLRFVRELGERAVTVLGNHDLFLLGVVFGGISPHKSDTFGDVLDAPDCLELCTWLRHLPLLYEDKGHILVHAGIPHIWSKQEAISLAREGEVQLRGPSFKSLFREMLGNKPKRWKNELKGIARIRCIINYLTRMRFVYSNGRLDFKVKGRLDSASDGLKAWFDYRGQIVEPVVFGHWAALDGKTNTESAIAVDTGCVWGRTLTAYRLEDNRRFTVNADSQVSDRIGQVR